MLFRSEVHVLSYLNALDPRWMLEVMRRTVHRVCFSLHLFFLSLQRPQSLRRCIRSPSICVDGDCLGGSDESLKPLMNLIDTTDTASTCIGWVDNAGEASMHLANNVKGQFFFLIWLKILGRNQNLNQIGRAHV